MLHERRTRQARIDLLERVRVSQCEQDLLVYRASHDPVTGLANAALFRDQLRAAAGRLEPGELTAVLIIDLDESSHGQRGERVTRWRGTPVPESRAGAQAM